MGYNQQLFIHLFSIRERMLQHLFHGLFLLAADPAHRHDGAVNQPQYRPDLQQAADKILHPRAAAAHI
ncbi:hypothetical protein D3C87_2134440 [compost metagenome]